MADTDPRLDTLARADAERLKAFAETLLPALGDVEVLQNRTGLVMLPMRDTAQGINFHLGEVLVSEAHIRAGRAQPGGAEGTGAQGYGMRRGHDLEAAMAMAVVDMALGRDASRGACEDFCAREAAALREADRQTLRRVEATRVDMETF